MTEQSSSKEPSVKKPFAPFENDHQSMQIGELIFENQTDKVIVYGDIDITKTVTGLEQALKLQQIFNDIVAQLQHAEQGVEADKTDNEVATEEGAEREQQQLGKEVDNPFS